MDKLQCSLPLIASRSCFLLYPPSSTKFTAKSCRSTQLERQLVQDTTNAFVLIEILPRIKSAYQRLASSSPFSGSPRWLKSGRYSPSKQRSPESLRQLKTQQKFCITGTCQPTVVCSALHSRCLVESRRHISLVTAVEAWLHRRYPLISGGEPHAPTRAGTGCHPHARGP